MDQILVLRLINSPEDGAHMLKKTRTSNTPSRGFTLTELLVVIIIIAILAAIIYPVFTSVRENDRQATSISNLHDISSKLAEYELDKHTVPSVLFANVYISNGSPTSMDGALTAAEADAALQTTVPATTYVDNEFPGLYPVYINSVTEFTDPNNGASSSDPTAITPSSGAGSVDVNVLGSSGTLSSGVVQFYTADAYDASPEITGANTLSANQLVARYQTAWTGVTTSGIVSPTAGWTIYPQPPTEPADSPQAIYQRQLHWQFPAADTYVTSTSYHVPKSNTVLVLYNDGSVKKLSSEQFTNRDGGTDPSSIAVNGNGVAGANFWQVLPSGK